MQGNAGAVWLAGQAKGACSGKLRLTAAARPGHGRLPDVLAARWRDVGDASKRPSSQVPIQEQLSFLIVLANKACAQAYGLKRLPARLYVCLSVKRAAGALSSDPIGATALCHQPQENLQ